MKKFVQILILVYAFTLTTDAQKKGGKNKVDKILLKMTTNLSLTIPQQNDIKPLLEAQIAERKMMPDKRKEQENSGEKPPKEARKKMKEDRKAKESAMDAKMASILDASQLEKYNLQKEEMKNKKGINSKRKKDNQ
jgi:protein CpxP